MNSSSIVRITSWRLRCFWKPVKNPASKKLFTLPLPRCTAIPTIFPCARRVIPGRYRPTASASWRRNTFAISTGKRTACQQYLCGSLRCTGRDKGRTCSFTFLWIVCVRMTKFRSMMTASKPGILLIVVTSSMDF
jgi:hypothetical protein